MTVARFELEAAGLVISHRWAALATLGANGPAASMVAYAPTRDASRLILFLSGLSEHTRNLINEPRVSLVVSEADPGRGDPQTLARVALRGIAEVIERNSPAFEDVWRIYIDRLPEAAPRIVLGDFSLFQVILDEAHYVGGFAQAHTIEVSRLSAAALEFEISAS
jgi:putative heme iron utilization protein